MLKTRVLTAAVLIPAVLAALFLLPPLYWALVTLAIIAVGAHEWSRLVGMSTTARIVLVGVVVAIGLTLVTKSAGFGRGWPDPVILAGCGLASVFWIVVAPPWVIGRWPTRGALRMGIVGVIVLIGAWMAIAELQARSPWLVLAAMAIVWIADTAAYFSGRQFGRHKLAPAVSPGKTWEGVFGAWVAVAIYAAILAQFAASAGFRAPVTAMTVAVWIVFAVLLAAISVVGDLFESLLKRHAEVKDSGTLLPGHGGILDRIDALLAAMPIAALAAQLFLRK
jgi:phosphatidate cytidylyltransferase